MILTVTLNPLLEKRLVFEKITNNHSNRAVNEYPYAGGKGINVSRQLNYLGALNSAFTFLGGNNGKQLRHVLGEEKIDFNFVPVKSETRWATVAIQKDYKNITTYFSPNQHLEITEIEEFKSRLEKMTRNCSIVVLSGSSPCAEANDIFKLGIELANEHDKISILDTYGSHLKEAISAGPTVLHNNLSELGKSLDLDLANEDAILSALDTIYNMGVKLAFITDGANPFYASKFDFHYKIISPKVNVIDATGSGDAFVAGIAYGLENSLIFDEFVKTAAALGALNAASINTCAVTKDELSGFVEQVQILPIGKKMKIIDDSPNY